MQKIVCFGEILWDLFPDGKKLGGAPLNVAISLKYLGADVEFVSRIGDDPLGMELLKKVESHGVSTKFLQKDTTYCTGKVQVNLDSKGIAQYKISKDAAWDFIEAQPEALKMVSNASAFIFGSLIARAKSIEALYSFLKVSKFRVFDLNLRAPFYNQQLLFQLMQQSDVLKFNDKELYKIANEMGSPFYSIENHIEFIAKKTKTKIICITKGKYGAVLYHKGDWYSNSGYEVEVIDTVGAGDSFLATLVNGLIEKQPHQKTIDRSCAMGALVASRSGANPVIFEDDLKNLMSNAVEN